MTNSIQALPVSDISSAQVSDLSDTGSETDFFDTLQGAMRQVDELHTDAQGKVAGMLSGSGEDVHSAMIAVEKAGLAFDMMVQVRNKIVQAYQTISQMPF